MSGYGYVYIESDANSQERAITLENRSEYWDTQNGSPALVEIVGPSSVNPEWKLVQDGQLVADAKFLVTLADNQRLVVSSYPENMYARVYNSDGTFSDVSQYADFAKVNFVRVPSGTSTFLGVMDKLATLNVMFKEERLLV